MTGKRILVVEDEYFIAQDLRKALVEAETTVIGPVGNVNDALSLLRDEPVDVAILDVNLAGTQSFPVADALRERSVPYMFLTGYDEWALPEEHRQAPRTNKPFATSEVLRCLRQLDAEGTSTVTPA